MNAAGACWPSPARARSPPRPWWLRWATPASSAAGVTWRPSPDVSSGTRDLRGCPRAPDRARGAQPMPVGIGEHLSAMWPRGRRANPRSPGHPKWLGPSAGDRRGFQRQIVDARGRPGETSGLVRPGAPAAQHRRRAQAAGHRQPWQHRPALVVRSWRPLGARASRVRTTRRGPVDHGAGDPDAPEEGHRGSSGQAGARVLGDSASRRDVPAAR